eukprot:scaffold13479_cov166-Amphora_coffeaeformis.AAC.7
MANPTLPNHRDATGTSSRHDERTSCLALSYLLMRSRWVRTLTTAYIDDDDSSFTAAAAHISKEVVWYS